MTLGSWILLGLIVALVIFLWFISQPPTIYQNRPGWVILNELTGLPCNNGRVYRTKDRAISEANKLRGKDRPLAAGLFSLFSVAYVSKEDLKEWNDEEEDAERL